MNKEKMLELIKENSKLNYGLINLYEKCEIDEIKDYILELLGLNEPKTFEKSCDCKREEFKNKISELLNNKENEND